MPAKCAEFLPNNFKAADLGSNGLKFADEMLSICSSLGKNGICDSVDPFPTCKGVIQMTSEQFIRMQDDSSLDLALCKQSIHFN